MRTFPRPFCRSFAGKATLIETARFSELFRRAGAISLSLPVLQPAHIFLDTAGEAVRRRMFVTEGRTGEQLCLRPDHTIPIAIHHLKHGTGPARYAYQGPVFRRSDAAGSEQLQAGIEAFGGADRVADDASMLMLACEAAQLMGEGKLSVEIGDQALFDALLAAVELPPAWRRRLSRIFGARELLTQDLERLAAEQTSLGTLPPPLRADMDEQELCDALARLMRKQGYPEGVGRTPREIATRFQTKRGLITERLEDRHREILLDYLAIRCPIGELPRRLSEFARRHGLDLSEATGFFVDRLRRLAAPASEATFNAAFGRDLDYYTGLVFEIALDGRVVVGGGRYDRLIGLLGGADAPAIGFSAYIGEDGARL